MNDRLFTETDTPSRLLTAAERRMSAARSDWDAAMLAELAQMQQPFICWQFALGRRRAALFPPPKGRLLQSFMNNQTKSRLATRGAAALISLIHVARLSGFTKVVMQ
jgi:hypothetical protein